MVLFAIGLRGNITVKYNCASQCWELRLVLCRFVEVPKVSVVSGREGGKEVVPV